MRKTHNIVLLATDKSDLMIDTIDESLYYHKQFPQERTVNVKPQHLYITSDEEIKEGDWIIDYGFTHKYKIKQWVGKDAYAMDLQGKIIATTDTSLLTCNGVKRVGESCTKNNNCKFPNCQLPQIPQEYIQYYVEQYNKGNVIEKCEVEYQELREVESGKMVYDYLKLTDNTINIVIPEEKERGITITYALEKAENKGKMYSREEVEKAFYAGRKTVPHPDWDYVYETFDEWIKENLK